MTKAPKNLGASVRARLYKLARERGDDFQLVLTRFANERLLYRLGVSEQASRFVLKGATMFTVWLGNPHRPTRDVDLLGRGDLDESALREIFRSIVTLPFEDGVVFDADTIRSGPIREDQHSGGVGLELVARIDTARLSLQVDIGFGDAITPDAKTISLPTMLPFAAPTLAAYPRETVVAEKLEAIIHIGLANTRMKDFYDLDFLAKTFSFDGDLLIKALGATFEHRATGIPHGIPIGLSDEFAEGKRDKWLAFLKKLGAAERPEFVEVVRTVRGFALEPLSAAETKVAFDKTWAPRGPWTDDQ